MITQYSWSLLITYLPRNEKDYENAGINFSKN